MIGSLVDLGELEWALATLRPVEREPLFLSAVEGFTAREIGELTDRPRGTVLSLIHRAKGKMRAALAAREAEVSA